MAGIRLQRFAAAATVVVCGCIALALTPAAIIPGSAGVAITIILLALQGLALAVPNVLIHLTRRLTVHHCGCSREVHYNIATGEAALRQRICAAFKDQATIEPAAIEGLEHPRGSGVVFPLSLVAAAVDSLLGSDCDLALLRPEPSVTRFRWADLQTKSSLGPEQLQTQQDFARCLAAKGYCMIRMPRERLDAPAAIFDEAEHFFRQPAASKARYRYGTASDELRHGWFDEANREYFEVHRAVSSESHSVLDGVGGAQGGVATDELPYPSGEFRTAADATYSTLEEVAHCSLQLLLPDGVVRQSTGSTDSGEGQNWSPGGPNATGEDSHIYRVDDDSARDSERKCLLGTSHLALNPTAAAMSHAAVRRTLLDGTSVDAEEGAHVQTTPSTLSTSMFRVHQYNSSDEHPRVSVTQLILGLRQQLQWLFRRLPFSGLVTTIISGATAGIPGLHADLGLVTVAPKSSAAGLLIYSRGRWKLVEAEMEQDDVVVFAGFTLGWITRGTYRPLLHGVRTMALRRSLIFFLRAHASAPLTRCRAECGRAEPCHDGAGKKGNEEAQDHIGARGLDARSVCTTAGQLQRDFNALRVERRIPIAVLRPLYRLLYYHAPWLHHTEADPAAH